MTSELATISPSLSTIRSMDVPDIERAQQGDRQALARVLEAIAPAVHRFGLRMCQHDADADDVVQDTLFAVTKHIGEFAGKASLTSWVFALARSACTRRRRGLKHRPHADTDALALTASNDPSPEQATEQGELRSALDSALRALSDEHREVLLLRDMEGLTAPEVADALGIGVHAVKSRLHRARRALQAGVEQALRSHEEAPLTDCPEVLSALSRKLEGELASEDCAEMEKHLATCPRCASLCASLRASLAACRAESQRPLPANVQAHVARAVRTLIGP